MQDPSLHFQEDVALDREAHLQAGTQAGDLPWEDREGRGDPEGQEDLEDLGDRDLVQWDLEDLEVQEIGDRLTECSVLVVVPEAQVDGIKVAKGVNRVFLTKKQEEPPPRLREVRRSRRTSASTSAARSGWRQRQKGARCTTTTPPHAPLSGQSQRART